MIIFPCAICDEEFPSVTPTDRFHICDRCQAEIDEERAVDMEAVAREHRQLATLVRRHGVAL